MNLALRSCNACALPDPAELATGVSESRDCHESTERMPCRSARAAAAGAAVLLAAGTMVLANSFVYGDYFTARVGILCAAILSCAMGGAALGEKTFCAVLCAACLFMGATVNPVRRGLPDLRGHTLGKAVEKIAREEEGKWIAVSDTWVTGNFLIMYGAPTVNCTNTYPNAKLWALLDPDKSMEEIWNRYAHITVELTAGGRVSAELPGLDHIRLSLPADLLPRIGVRFVVSDKDLTVYNNDSLFFTPVFADERVRHRIYELRFSSSGSGD